MAVAAFKSSSRRGNLTSPSVTVSARGFREEARKKAPVSGRKAMEMEMEGTPKVQSLSRLDTSRGNRSASQVPVLRRHYSTSKGKAEQDCSITISKDGNNLDLLGSNRKGGLPRSNNGVVNQTKKLQTWSSRHSSCASSDNSAAILAIRRSNTIAAAITNVADIPPDLINPDAVELALEIRREYSKMLGESQERARKLRADLAVEERRTQELESVLKEVLPYPKNPNVLKSRPREDDPPLNLFGSSMPSDSHLPEARPFEGPEPHHAKAQWHIILSL